MKTELRRRYERKFQSILDDLEDKIKIENTNYDLKNFAEPSKKSFLNDLIEKSKEMAFEIGLELDNKAPFELTDSQIIALNLFFKL